MILVSNNETKGVSNESIQVTETDQAKKAHSKATATEKEKKQTERS